MVGKSVQAKLMVMTPSYLEESLGHSSLHGVLLFFLSQDVYTDGGVFGKEHGLRDGCLLKQMVAVVQILMQGKIGE
jgi:hypothetical protein